MSAGLPMFIIEPSGSITERYVPRLPDLRQLQNEYLNGEWGEHVTVLWNGKRAHMFVDETGALKLLEPNAKATAIYHNATRSRAKLTLYGNLQDKPDDYMLADAPLIYGRAVFWPHAAPEWE